LEPLFDCRSRLSLGIGRGSFGRSRGVAGGVAVHGIKLGQNVGARVIFCNGCVTEIAIVAR